MRLSPALLVGKFRSGRISIIFEHNTIVCLCERAKRHMDEILTLVYQRVFAFKIIKNTFAIIYNEMIII